MAWFKNVPLLSLALLFITYSTFGWFIERGSPILSQIILDRGRAWGWQGILDTLGFSEEIAALGLVYGLALVMIALITLSLIAPVALITIVFGSSFKSDAWSIISILLWSFAFVFMLRWIAITARLLLLIASAILAKLDLQDRGYQGWLVFTLVTLTCFVGFGMGAIAHSFYG